MAAKITIDGLGDHLQRGTNSGMTVHAACEGITQEQYKAFKSLSSLNNLM